MTENRLDINQEEAPKAPPAKKRNPIFDIQLNKKAIIPLILLVCSILLILVNFLPMVSTTVELNGYKSNAPLNSLDCLKLMYFQTGAGNLEYSDEYVQLANYGYPKLSESMLTLGLTKELLFAEIMNADAYFKIASFCMGIAVVVNLVFCILLFANSALYLVYTVFNKQEFKQKRYAVLNKIRSISLLYFLLSPFFGYLIMRGASCGVGEMRIRALESTLGIGFIFALILSAAMVVLLFKDLVIKLKDKIALIKNQYNKLIALGFVLVLLISLCLPIMSVKVVSTVNDNYARENVWIGYGDIYCVNGSDFEYYRDSDAETVQEIVHDNISYHDKTLDKTVLGDIIIGVGRKNYAFWSYLFYIFHVISLLCLAIIGKRLIFSILYDTDVVIKNPVTISIISAVLQFVSIAAIVLIGSTSVWGQQVILAKFNFGVGILLGLISCVGMLCGVIKNKKTKSNEINRDFDNPDVSYAPYVVGSNKE